MKVMIDADGRIELDRNIQTELGVAPGDEVILENRGNEWVIKAAKCETGLCHEGNVLVHRGTSPDAIASTLVGIREERLENLSRGLRP